MAELGVMAGRKETNRGRWEVGKLEWRGVRRWMLYREGERNGVGGVVRARI